MTTSVGNMRGGSRALGRIFLFPLPGRVRGSRGPKVPISPLILPTDVVIRYIRYGGQWDPMGGALGPLGPLGSPWGPLAPQAAWGPQALHSVGRPFRRNHQQLNFSVIFWSLKSSIQGFRAWLAHFFFQNLINKTQIFSLRPSAFPQTREIV